MYLCLVNSTGEELYPLPFPSRTVIGVCFTVDFVAFNYPDHVLSTAQRTTDLYRKLSRFIYGMAASIWDKPWGK